ncbi:MAG: hypothetical protein LKM39_00440 [Chiayiivirga sp.]|nr:hypothetical protein [Chiayiivirga sp.]
MLPSFPRWNAPVPVANALSIEVGFYLLMPLLARHRSTAVLALLLGMFIVADHGFGVDSFANRYAWFLPSTPAFALGSVIFHWRESLARIAAPRLALLAWLAHSVLIWWLPVWPWTYGLYVSLLLSAWVVISLAERPTSRFDNVMGELSYPFYLLHSTAGVLLFAWFGYDRRPDLWRRRGGTDTRSLVGHGIAGRPPAHPTQAARVAELQPHDPSARPPATPSSLPSKHRSAPECTRRHHRTPSMNLDHLKPTLEPAGALAAAAGTRASARVVARAQASRRRALP